MTSNSLVINSKRLNDNLEFPSNMSYRIVITGWFARLGNNLTQIVHGYHLAEKTQSRLILPPHNFFDTGSVQAVADFSLGTEMEEEIENKFFFTRHQLFQEHPISLKERRSHLRKVLPLLMGSLIPTLPGAADLVIHIRSGDVFLRLRDDALRVPRIYCQPPLSFYKKIITEGEFRSVQIVAQDDLNPCINALLAWDKRIIFKKQPLLEDIQTVLRAKNLVIGFGTFAFNWALASHCLETLYTRPVATDICGELKDGDLKEIRIRAYEVLNYIESGDWQCRPDQIDLMLQHPERDVVAVQAIEQARSTDIRPEIDSSQYRMLLQKFVALELRGPVLEELPPLIAAVTDWQRFLTEAENHGMSGLLHKHADSHSLGFPQPVMLSLKALFIRHRASADTRYEVVTDLLERLREVGSPALILKGLVLSPMIYPYDGLRPMRDIDILISRGKKALVKKTVRELGFNLPDKHHNRYMRGSNQMPNAMKTVKGFKISLEVHHDAIGRDTCGHLYYEDIQNRQIVKWRGLELMTMGHELMLHQLCRHLEGRHPGSRLKLINVMDAVLYSEHFLTEVDWQLIARRYGHVINTLKCLHLMVPLSESLQRIIGGVNQVHIDGVGVIMPNLENIVLGDMSLMAKLRSLFLPSDWWLHLFYGVPPGKSLTRVKLLRHPVALVVLISKRIISRVLGG